MSNRDGRDRVSRRSMLLGSAAAATGGFQLAQAQQPTRGGAPAANTRPPNILLIMGDDIGWWNVSVYNHGAMGYRTPNIDRIAREGAFFTDWYGQQSCTAGRAAFITGQSPIRTGLTKVGLPGADIGLRPEDPTFADLLKPLGYATGQFGKNHLGDKDEFLPTNHGFDEFFGNLYHLNAEEEPENPDYPRDPRFRQRFGPRGVIRSYADGRIQDTGPLTRKRMETVDQEFLDAAIDFIDRQHRANRPFCCYFNSTRMHVFTHLSAQADGKTGLGLYPDGMVEHDGHVGTLLQKLDQLGIADNTIVIYTTDNGAEVMTWPDGGATPFRGEKATNWEGGFRVPFCMRWPGVIRPGTVVNEMCAHEDILPTLLAAAGVPDIVERCLRGHQAGGKTFRVHLDGYNLLPFLKGDQPASPRNEFFYWNDDGKLVALRYQNWKFVFAEQRSTGMQVWSEEFTNLRAPSLFNIRADPFERGPESALYAPWVMARMFMIVPAQAAVAQHLESFRDFPPRQRPASFSIDQVMEAMQRAAAASRR